MQPRVVPRRARSAGIPRRAWNKDGYGLEYALDDFIVYAYYGHKREHTAQIAVFRDTLK
jgi:hypothetical protein